MSTLKLLYIMRGSAAEVFLQEKSLDALNSKYLDHSYTGKYLILHYYYLFVLPNL